MLRDELIEAGARERYERMVARMVVAAEPKLMLLPEWSELEGDDRQAQLDTSAMYLDAFLDYLEAHADKWGYEHLQPPGIRDLIAALRPPVSSSRENPE